MDIRMSTCTLGEDRMSISTFASDIPLPVGDWPMTLTVTDDVTGGVFVFLKTRPIIRNGEFQGYDYVNRQGTYTLHVFND